MSKPLIGRDSRRKRLMMQLRAVKTIFAQWREGDLEDDAFEQQMAAILHCQGGHTPMDDHCMNPDHRFCARCNAPTPNQPVVAYERHPNRQDKEPRKVRAHG